MNSVKLVFVPAQNILGPVKDKALDYQTVKLRGFPDGFGHIIVGSHDIFEYLPSRQGDGRVTLF